MVLIFVLDAGESSAAILDSSTAHKEQYITDWLESKISSDNKSYESPYSNAPFPTVEEIVPTLEYKNIIYYSQCNKLIQLVIIGAPPIPDFHRILTDLQVCSH